MSSLPSGLICAADRAGWPAGYSCCCWTSTRSSRWPDFWGLFGHGRRALASFHPSGHLYGDGGPLKAQLEQILAQAGLAGGGPIRWEALWLWAKGEPLRPLPPPSPRLVSVGAHTGC